MMRGMTLMRGGIRLSLWMGLALILGPGLTDAAAQVPISSIEELQLIGNNVAYPLDGHYILTQDIDASVTETWNDGAGFEPIGVYGQDEHGIAHEPFTGRFDGQGFTIAGLVIDRPDEDDVGLFGVIDEGGQVENLVLTDSIVVGKRFTGGLAAILGNGLIRHCSFSGALSSDTLAGGLVGINAGTILASDATGTVTATQYAGGLCGTNEYGLISHSLADAAVTGIADVGGLVGGNAGTLLMSYAHGAVTGEARVGGLVGYHQLGTVTHCYAAGAVEGDTQTGGLIGLTDTGAVQVSFWDTDSSGQLFSDGGMGRGTAQMVQRVTFGFEGWSFDHDWHIDEGQSYPYHRWQALPEGLRTGSLQVVVEPEEAREAGAYWRRVGTAFWRESGDTEFYVPIGPRTIEFRTLDEWDAPGEENVFIDPDQTAHVTATYRAGTGDPDDPPPMDCWGNSLEAKAAGIPLADLLVLLTAGSVVIGLATLRKRRAA